MKKPSTLSEQVRQAQKVVNGWTDLQKSLVHLQGTDAFLITHAQTNRSSNHSTNSTKKRVALSA